MIFVSFWFSIYFYLLTVWSWSALSMVTWWSWSRDIDTPATPKAMTKKQYLRWIIWFDPIWTTVCYSTGTNQLSYLNYKTRTLQHSKPCFSRPLNNDPHDVNVIFKKQTLTVGSGQDMSQGVQCQSLTLCSDLFHGGKTMLSYFHFTSLCQSCWNLICLKITCTHT